MDLLLRQKRRILLRHIGIISYKYITHVHHRRPTLQDR